MDEQFAPLVLVLLFSIVPLLPFTAPSLDYSSYWEMHWCGFLHLTRKLVFFSRLKLCHVSLTPLSLSIFLLFFCSISLLCYLDTLFLVAAIIAAYTRELAHRRVYYVVHQILNSAAQLKHYTPHANFSTSHLSFNSSLSPSGSSRELLASPPASPPLSPSSSIR